MESNKITLLGATINCPNGGGLDEQNWPPYGSILFDNTTGNFTSINQLQVDFQNGSDITLNQNLPLLNNGTMTVDNSIIRNSNFISIGTISTINIIGNSSFIGGHIRRMSMRTCSSMCPPTTFP